MALPKNSPMRPDHVPGPLQTLKLMLTALAILFLGVSVFAYAWGGQSPWAARAPFTPADDETSELLGQLRREGMDCQPRAGRREMFDCTYRHPAGDGRAGAAAGIHARVMQPS